MPCPHVIKKEMERGVGREAWWCVHAWFWLAPSTCCQATISLYFPLLIIHSPHTHGHAWPFPHRVSEEKGKGEKVRPGLGEHLLPTLHANQMHPNLKHLYTLLLPPVPPLIGLDHLSRPLTTMVTTWGQPRSLPSLC
jgi:hypothetical protein